VGDARLDYGPTVKEILGAIPSNVSYVPMDFTNDDLLKQLDIQAQSSGSARGDFALRGERVAPDGEQLLTFSGIGIYRPDLFSAIDAGKRAQLAPVLRAAMDKAAVSGQHYRGLWFDVGTPARLAELNRLVGH
jgi:NDP-sugar pyrophosphorylase family protein